MENLGEPSRKSKHGDEEDRPLKKARYVWQLKGKYHLKQSNAKPPTTQSDTDSESESVNNALCDEHCCISDLISKSEALLETNEDSDQDVSVYNIDKSISDEIPVTLVKPSSKNQDEFLHKWQAIQVAKSFVDNTINSILEHWKIAPFDAADFVEDCENGEQVEDEGILMAIQSHGLQSSQGEASHNYQYKQEQDSMDFLDAAVSVAIQKKGLSSYNYG